MEQLVVCLVIWTMSKHDASYGTCVFVTLFSFLAIFFSKSKNPWVGGTRGAHFGATRADCLGGDAARVGRPTPTGTDCYRFALSHPQVDMCLAGPDNVEHMKQALAALELGPMDEDELAWMRGIGDHIYATATGVSLMDGK